MHDLGEAMNTTEADQSNWFKSLPVDWQGWVIENIERGCDPVEIAHTLKAHGWGAVHLSAASIEGQIRSSTMQAEESGLLSTSSLSADWQKWLVQCDVEKIPDEQVIATLQQEGYTEAVIRREMANLRQSPYAELAYQMHATLKKRHWLMQTQDHLARLNPAYCTCVDKIKTPDFSAFVQRYYSRHLPIILTGGVDHWPARQRWSPQYFADRVGEVLVEVQQGRESNPLYERYSANYRAQMPMKDFVAQVLSVERSNNLYMTANNTGKNADGIAVLFDDLGDFAQGYTCPDQMKSRSFLWFGPKGTFTPLHHDLTNNMLVQLYGRKKVTLFPALQVPYLYNDHWVYSEIGNPHDPAIRQRYPLLEHTTPLEVILEPGDALFIPIGWWHCVDSLDISISISFTHFNAANDFADTFSV